MGELFLINFCDGLFLDIGGNMNGYGFNEDFEMIFCLMGVGENIQLIFLGMNIQFGDLLCFYDGEDISVLQLVCLNEFIYGNGIIIQAIVANFLGCVMVIFIFDVIGEDVGWSVNIECIQDCQMIFFIIVFFDFLIVLVDIGYIDICFGDWVFFEGVGIYL